MGEASRSEGLDDHIGLNGECSNLLLAVGCVQVYGDAPLIGIQVKKECALFRIWPILGEGTMASGWVTTQRFDLDDLGAIVSQKFAGERASHLCGQLKHPNPRQRLIPR